jgi:hypothetical protein
MMSHCPFLQNQSIPGTELTAETFLEYFIFVKIKTISEADFIYTISQTKPTRHHSTNK